MVKMPNHYINAENELIGYCLRSDQITNPSQHLPSQSQQ